MAMFRPPFALTAAGTVAAMVASVLWVGMTVVGRATDDEVVDGAAVVEELPELLLQAAPSTATAAMTVATVNLRSPRWLGMPSPP